MKSRFLSGKRILVILAMLVAMNANAQWVQMSNGITNGDTFALAGNDSNLYTASGAGLVWRSTNNGASWIQTSLSVSVVYSLAMLGNNIFAGTGGTGVFLSTNNGTNWTQTSLNNKDVYSLMSVGNNLYAGASFDGVYLSTDNGVTWSQTSYILPYQWVWCLASDGNNIFAGGSGISLSSNNGTNWTKLSLSEEVRSIGINGNTIFAGTTFSDIWVSTNYGINWVRQFVCFPTVYSIVKLGNNVFIGGSEGVFLTTNNGLSWANKNQGFYTNGHYIRCLHISNNYIFAGHQGVYSVWRRTISEITGIQNISTETPSSYSLSQNYPNPFNPTTNIKFSIIKTEQVKLIVYDIQGREVRTLVNESLKPGTYEAAFDGSMLNSGVYFYKLITGTFSETKKMLLIK